MPLWTSVDNESPSRICRLDPSPKNKKAPSRFGIPVGYLLNSERTDDCAPAAIVEDAETPPHQRHAVNDYFPIAPASPGSLPPIVAAAVSAPSKANPAATNITRR